MNINFYLLAIFHENASFSGVWRQTAWSWSVIHNQTLLVGIINVVLMRGNIGMLHQL
jgi:hypothetical protein